MCYNVFNVWPKTTLILSVWSGDAKNLGTLAYIKYCVITVVTMTMISIILWVAQLRNCALQGNGIACRRHI